MFAFYLDFHVSPLILKIIIFSLLRVNVSRTIGIPRDDTYSV